MILKILSHKKPVFAKLLNYMIHDKDRLFSNDKKSFVITHNLKGKGIATWTKQYLENEKHRKVKRSDSILCTHEILSWHRKDSENLTLAKLENMTREYISKRNPNGIYLAVPHQDKEHMHVHILASGIEYKTGKSLHIAKPELAKLKKEIQAYQKETYPELSHSIVNHGGKEKTSNREYNVKERTGKASDKENLLTQLQNIYNHAESTHDFFNELEKQNLPTYIRGNKTYGITFNERKYRFKTLGFTEEKINRLDLIKEKREELSRQRSSQDNAIQRSK